MKKVYILLACILIGNIVIGTHLRSHHSDEEDRESEKKKTKTER
jgi:hypothetical protein